MLLHMHSKESSAFSSTIAASKTHTIQVLSNATLSQPSDTNITSLPSAYTWPAEDTIPSQYQMSYDLTGITGSSVVSAATQKQTRRLCGSYEHTAHLLNEKEQEGYGLAGVERWMGEVSSRGPWVGMGQV
jgi:hypothetical protein